MKSKWDIKKLKEIRLSGKTYKQIGDIYNVSGQRILQLIGKGRLLIYPKGYKKCYGYCKKVLPYEDFYKNCKRCKKCTKENTYPYLKKYYKEYNKGGKYYEKARARCSVSHALKSGKIIKGNCFMKNKECSGRIEGDHYLGYDKSNWLTVRWVCQSHHKKIDKVGWGNIQ